MDVVLEVVPVRQLVDEIRCSIQEVERLGRLRLVRWEEMGREVAQGVQKGEEVGSDTVVSVIGRRATAKGERVAEGGFVGLEDVEGRGDVGSRG